VKIGGRGKAGGIKVAQDEAEARRHAEAILGMDIKGFTVHELWIEGASQIESEYYASVIFDRAAKAPFLMLSTQGGMDIEAVAEETPEALATLHVDPLIGFQDFHGRRLAYEAGIPADLVRPVGAFLKQLYDVFVREEAMLVEVNPVIVTPDRTVAALDAKVTLDDNALFRHPENAELRDPSAEDPQEQMAHERGLTYVKLDGDIGILGNGAGPGHEHARRRRPVRRRARELPRRGRRLEGRRGDLRGGGHPLQPEREGRAVQHLRRDHPLRRGGPGLIEAFRTIEPTGPFVVRLDGTNDVEGRRILAEADLPNVHTAQTMNEAAEKVVELAR
jgi:succinyl-CoA synthetase beta subunit